ncbi:MAG: nucleoside deaminase [Mycobacterium sp.]
MRLAGVTAAGASIGACTPRHPDTTEAPSTTSPNASGSLALPYLFDDDPTAQQLARRLLAAASNVQDMPAHERFMRLAIEQSKGNPSNPAGSVIVDRTSGEVLGQGVNHHSQNPMLHGEVVAVNDYVSRHGNAGWDRTTLYTTGEPCAMCCGVLAWAGIPRVVWASSVAVIRKSGLSQIDISALEAAARAYQVCTPELYLGGVLADETDKLWAARVR